MRSTDEMSWLEVFEQNKESFYSIKNEIDEIEHSIDSQIFAIYGLKESEISIVENSLSRGETDWKLIKSL